MNFSAIIGNPPYMEINQGYGNGADPIFHMFIDLGMELSKIGSFIHPARFLFNVGKTPKKWNYEITHNQHIKVSRFWLNSSEVFPIVAIPGGIATTYWNKDVEFGIIGSFSPYPELSDIVDKVLERSNAFMSSIVYPREYYKITEALYEEHPDLEHRQSSGHKFSLGANIFDVFPELFHDKITSELTDNLSKVFGRKKWSKSI